LPPGVPLNAGSQDSSIVFDFGGVLDQNVLFSTFDLENDGQGHIFSRSREYTNNTPIRLISSLKEAALIQSVDCQFKLN
jgi:hypothetical protein